MIANGFRGLSVSGLPVTTENQPEIFPGASNEVDFATLKIY